jgi:hypothetical protein
MGMGAIFPRCTHNLLLPFDVSPQNVGCLLCNLLRHYLTSIPHSDPPRRRSRCCTTLRKVRDGIVRACAGNKDRPVAINPAEVVVVINLFGGEFRREMWPSVNVGTDGAACLGPSIKTIKTAAPASPRDRFFTYHLNLSLAVSPARRHFGPHVFAH